MSAEPPPHPPPTPRSECETLSSTSQHSFTLWSDSGKLSRKVVSKGVWLRIKMWNLLYHLSTQYHIVVKLEGHEERHVA